jgi:hypothetical protein
VYVATTGGSMATDIMSYEVTKGIVEHGTVAMSYNVFQMEAHRGVDGRYYAPYGIGHAVYSIPFYALARLAERATGLSLGKSEAIPKAGFVLGSAVAAALVVWVAFLFASWLSGDIRASVITAAAVGFGTFLWPYAKFGFNAPLGALCVMTGTYGVWVGARFDRPLTLTLGGAGCAGAVLVKHELGLLCLPVALWILIESRWDWRKVVRRGVLSGLPVIAAVLVTLYYNQTRFGNPFDTGYLRDQSVVVGSFWDGVTGLLFSPGGSVFWYSPVLIAGVAALVALRRQDPATVVLLGGEFLMMLFFYAKFTHWDGERSYGPRYLLPVAPLLGMSLAPWLARHPWPSMGRRAVMILLTVSCLIQIPGILVDFSKADFGPTRTFTWDERRWSWSGSALRLNAEASLTAIPTNVRYLIGAAPRPAVKPAEGDARDFSEQYAFSLDFWWVYLYYLGAISASVALTLGAACVAAIAVSGYALITRLPGDDRGEAFSSTRPGARPTEAPADPEGSDGLSLDTARGRRTRA